MLSIRLARVGKKKKPTYRVVVQEQSKDPFGKALEILGFYDPRIKPKVIKFNEERVKYWLSQGAQCTSVVHNLLVDGKIVKGPKRKATKQTKGKKGKEGEVKKGEVQNKPASSEKKNEDSKTDKEAGVQSSPAPVVAETIKEVSDTKKEVSQEETKQTESPKKEIDKDGGKPIDTESPDEAKAEKPDNNS